MLNNLIIPSQIPWPHLKGHDLEELLYWLVDAMGGKDLEWRIGGKGAGTSDQGRDLECSFYMATPEGDLIRQKWWIEAKGRKSTVEPIEVKEAVLNASGNLTVDILVIATNTNFSNPTRDWVKQWQENNPRPKIKLWEKPNLEKLCSQHPEAVIRLFSEALSPQGKVEVLKTKFWNYSAFSDYPLLKEIWKDRKKVKFDCQDVLAIITSECANGYVIIHPWVEVFDNDLLLNALANGLLNYPYLNIRAQAAGVEQTPLTKAITYLLLGCINRFASEAVINLLNTVWDHEEAKYPSQIKSMIMEPILNQLSIELRDACTIDCERISQSTFNESSTVQIDKYYWDRLIGLFRKEEDEEEPRKVLTIENIKKPCNVGFKMSKQMGCPLTHYEVATTNLTDSIRMFEKIIRFRKVERLKQLRELEDYRDR